MNVKVIFSFVFAVVFGSILHAEVIKGAGSTLAYPVISEYVNSYTQSYTPISYAPIGSYLGIEQFLAKQISFAVSDVPLNQVVKKSTPAVIEIPLAVGATAIVFTLPNELKTLKLNSAVLVQIFSGKIKNWNDPQLVQLNSHLTLPDLPIKVIVRSDQSGTSHMLTDFFAKQDKQWAKKKGAVSVFPGPPGSVGVTGSEQMAATVVNTQGAIGYVEWHFAHKYKLGIAAVQNVQGQFVLPNLDSIRLTLSSESLVKKSLVSSPKNFTYPICGFTWIMVYKNAEIYGSFEKSTEIVNFLKWTLQDGQLISESMDYPAIPSFLMKDIHNTLRQITYEGIIVY